MKNKEGLPTMKESVLTKDLLKGEIKDVFSGEDAAMLKG